MSKVAVSVSMELEQATRYRGIASDTGESFSAVICRLASAGEGLPAEELPRDDVPAASVNGHKQGEEASPPETGSGPETETPPGPPPVEMSDPPAQEEDVRPANEFPDIEKLKGKSILERVYSCIGAEPASVAAIAAHLGVEDVVVGEVIEELIASGQPLILRRMQGDWKCWEVVE